MRIDIQALRGYAVLLVLFHHAEIGPFQGGYLGVDIFFVISGFLITGLIKKAVDNNNFSFSEFYFRRAKRLLPAAYVTFLCTALLAPFFLNSLELDDFSTQLLGAVTFTGNIALWQQVGYFEGASELKPLLHVWSLAIEEQYYLLLPAAMLFLKPKYWLTGAIFLLVASLALCIVFQPIKPIATFYLLPTRAWELMIGSVAAIACLEQYRVVRAWRRPLFFIGLAAIIYSPWKPVSDAHPSYDAFIVCLGTLFIIISTQAKDFSNLPTKLLAKTGDISYSLYLIHWPLFAYLNNAAISTPSTTLRVSTLMLSLILAALMYRFVEQSFRQMKRSSWKKFTSAAVFSSSLLIALPFGLAKADFNEIDYEHIRRVNYGLDKSCDYDNKFQPKESCRTSEQPELFIWGDSFAMHLVQGIKTQTNQPLEQCTSTSCGPILNITFHRDPRYSKAWAEACILYNNRVFEYLTQQKSISTVILSSPFNQYLEAYETDKENRTVFIENGEIKEETANIQRATNYFVSTVEKIKGLGKQVIIVGPPPSSNFDIGKCLERKSSGHVIIGGNQNCQIPYQDYLNKFGRVSDFLARVSEKTGAHFIDFGTLLCDTKVCHTETEDTFLYRDTVHLSYDGSVYLAKQIGWANLVKNNSD